MFTVSSLPLPGFGDLQLFEIAGIQKSTLYSSQTSFNETSFFPSLNLGKNRSYRKASTFCSWNKHLYFHCVFNLKIPLFLQPFSHFHFVTSYIRACQVLDIIYSFALQKRNRTFICSLFTVILEENVSSLRYLCLNLGLIPPKEGLKYTMPSYLPIP